MGKDDFHDKEFDPGTITKLELFRNYAKEWFPVFLRIKKPHWETIEVYDFFSGAGRDTSGRSGSPLIILESLIDYCSDIKAKGISVNLVFNDFDNKKTQRLKQEVNRFFEECEGGHGNVCEICKAKGRTPFKVFIENKDFNKIFDEKYVGWSTSPEIPRLMFLDQYGVSFVDVDVYRKLTKLQATDFLFFISSAHTKRFKELPSFQQYLDYEDIDFDGSKPAHVHRVIHEYFKRKKPKKEYYVGAFSIKKPSGNIYGVIFNSNHPLGMEKFLASAWKLDNLGGEANYNIDDEPIRDGQTSIFDAENKIKKLQRFEDNLIKFLNEEARTNVEVYKFSLENGISTKRANDVLKDLEKSGKLSILPERRTGVFYLSHKPKKRITIHYENNEN